MTYIEVAWARRYCAPHLLYWSVPDRANRPGRDDWTVTLVDPRTGAVVTIADYEELEQWHMTVNNT